jgi:NAD(P)-dependent dehydrogenase (short-subunit alcohol dehydrogenase family)
MRKSATRAKATLIRRPISVERSVRLGLASLALAKEVDRFGVRVLIVEPGALRTSFNGPRRGQLTHSCG